MIEISEVIRPPPSGSTIWMSGSALKTQSGGISTRQPPNGVGIRQNPGCRTRGCRARARGQPVPLDVELLHLDGAVRAQVDAPVVQMNLDVVPGGERPEVRAVSVLEDELVHHLVEQFLEGGLRRSDSQVRHG